MPKPDRSDSDLPSALCLSGSPTADHAKRFMGGRAGDQGTEEREVWAMTDALRKAAEMALDWMERYQTSRPIFVIAEPIKALRQALAESANSTTDFVESKALAQPEQEPVAGMFNEKLPDQNPPSWVRDYKPKREWVGLKHEEIADALLPLRNQYVASASTKFKIGKAIEAKLKEKNFKGESNE